MKALKINGKHFSPLLLAKLMKTNVWLYCHLSLKALLKQILNLIIIFQLAIYPVSSTADPLTEKEEKNLQTAKQFNERHVQSLRDFIFNSEDTIEEYYKSHPLDVFGLLKQKIHYKHPKLSKQEKVLENLSGSLSKLSVKAMEVLGEIIVSSALDLPLIMDGNTDDSKLNKLLNKLKTEGLTKNELDQLKVELEGLSPEETRLTKDELDGLKDEIESLAEKTEDQTNRQKSRVGKLQQKKIKDPIKARHLFVEIFEDTEEKALQAVLVHPSQRAIAPLVVEDKSKYKGSVYKNRTGKRLSFSLSYQGKKLHSFPQNIEWLAFFNDYLVFLEASKVSNEKALISFIDLKYFEKAIGRTALPLFYIPLHFQKTALTPEAILSPKDLSLTDSKKLSLGGLTLSIEQINHLSQLQQMSFNVTVALLDPASAAMSQKFLREIVNNFEQSLTDSKNLESSEAKNISLDTKQLVLRLLENRRQIGSPKDTSGRYGALNKLSTSLSLLQEKK